MWDNIRRGIHTYRRRWDRTRRDYPCIEVLISSPARLLIGRLPTYVYNLYHYIRLHFSCVSRYLFYQILEKNVHLFEDKNKITIVRLLIKQNTTCPVQTKQQLKKDRIIQIRSADRKKLRF